MGKMESIISSGLLDMNKWKMARNSSLHVPISLHQWTGVTVDILHRLLHVIILIFFSFIRSSSSQYNYNY